MKSFKQSLILLLHFVFALSAFCSYAHEEPIDVKESETEIWELQLTGDTEGKLKMKLKRVQMASETYSIIGEFSGRIEDHIGGRGRLKCKLEGKIDRTAFLADFSGSAGMQAAHVLVRGTIKGSISDSHGFGTWNMRHSRGSSAGKWTMKKSKL